MIGSMISLRRKRMKSVNLNNLLAEFGMKMNVFVVFMSKCIILMSLRVVPRAQYYIGSHANCILTHRN